MFTPDAKVSDAVRALYERATVIDGLASPDTYNIPLPPPGILTPEKLRNVRESGISAINLTVGGQGDLATTLRDIGGWMRQIETHGDYLLLVRQHTDIAQAAAQKKLGLIFGFQGLGMLGDDLRLVDRFSALGVNVMQLTYNGRDAFGAGCACSDQEGLTPLGHEAVRRMNTLGVLVDVSHANPTTAAQAVQASSHPIAITHTGARAIHTHPRNQPDTVLRAVAESGGVVGIFLMPFLGADPREASRALFMRHLRHALDVCGEDHVGIGSDQSITPVEINDDYMAIVRQQARLRLAQGQGTPGEGDAPVTVPELNSPRRLELIAAELDRAGYPPRVLEKVLGQNFDRLFAAVWPGKGQGTSA